MDIIMIIIVNNDLFIFIAYVYWIEKISNIFILVFQNAFMLIDTINRSYGIKEFSIMLNNPSAEISMSHIKMERTTGNVSMSLLQTPLSATIYWRLMSNKILKVNDKNVYVLGELLLELS